MKILKTNDIVKGEMAKNENDPYISPDIAFGIIINDEKIIHAKIEQKEGNLLGVYKISAFAKAVHLAYCQHLPLVITPDIIWHLISLGVSTHVNQNSERLKNVFADYDGKKNLTVYHDLAKNIPWDAVIDEFSNELDSVLKVNIASIMTANFSTTNQISKLVSQIVVLDTVQKYVDCFTLSLCGIPEIKVDGCKDDWLKVKSKTVEIIKLIPELNVWFKNAGLEEILDNFISIFDDKIDNDFWNLIYKKRGGSGGPYLSGWMIALFPYITKMNKKNPYVWETSWKEIVNETFYGGLTLDSFQIYLGKITTKYKNQSDKNFIGGLVGVLHGNDQSLLPVFGYAVTEKK